MFKESSPQQIKPYNLHAPIGTHGPYGLLGWGTTRREHKVPSGTEARNGYFEELRVVCREFRNSLASGKGVQVYRNKKHKSKTNIQMQMLNLLRRQHVAVQRRPLIVPVRTLTSKPASHFLRGFFAVNASSRFAMVLANELIPPLRPLS